MFVESERSHEINFIFIFRVSTPKQIQFLTQSLELNDTNTFLPLPPHRYIDNWVTWI